MQPSSSWSFIIVPAIGRQVSACRPHILLTKDFEFVPLMFVTLGFGSKIPLLNKAIFRGLGTPIQGYKRSGYKGKLAE